MKNATTLGLSLVFALGLTFPLAAQEQSAAEADADQNEMVTREEAMAYSERLFDEISEGGDEITMEQFNAAMVGGATGSAEDQTAWGQAGLDESGAMSRDAWMQWREERFDEAAGPEGEVEAGLYSSLYTGDMTGGDDTTGGAVSAEPSAGAEPNPDATDGGAGAAPAPAD